MSSAIVLSLTKYSDTGSVVHLYTAEHGRMQYVVYGNKHKGVLRPLSIVEVTSTRRNNVIFCCTHLHTTAIKYRCTTSMCGDVYRRDLITYVATSDERYALV